MANEVEKYNTLALADIEKINGLTDDDIEKLNGFEYTGATAFKGILAFGALVSGSATGITNLVNTSGIVASDTSAVASADRNTAGCEYGTGTALFAFGYSGYTNLVNTSGVVASNVSLVGTARHWPSASAYGTGLGIFVFGDTP